MRKWLIPTLLLLAPSLASAHESWFIEPGSVHMARPEIFSFPTAPGIYLATSALVVLILMFATRRWYQTSPLVRRVESWFVFPLHARQVLAVLVGVSLMGNGLLDLLVAPNNAIPAGSYGVFLKWFEILLGTAFIFAEYFTFECALLLLAFLGFAAPVTPLSVMGEDLIFPAVAILLLFTAPRVPFLKGRKKFDLAARRKAYQWFRVILGFSFLYLASEKWIHPEISLELVSRYHLNFLASFGVTAATFTYCAALVETVAATAVIFNLWIRPVSLALFIMFTLSVFVLGPTELIGHLPIKAALMCLMYYGHTYRHKHVSHAFLHGDTTQAFEKLPV